MSPGRNSYNISPRLFAYINIDIRQAIMSINYGSSDLLEHVYHDLDLVGGTLLDAADSPSIDDAHRWTDLGDWLLLAERVKAERIFFLNGDPVLVFSSLPSGSDEEDVFDCYRRTWSLARPRCLFLAVGSELRVYSLASPPTVPGTRRTPPEPLEIVTRAADVSIRLASFHRERLESGVAFEDAQMAEQSGRADQQLLRDVRAATGALVDAGLAPRIAHTLIERAILVRYLEDREIITEAYFDAILSNQSQALSELDSGQSAPDFGPPSRFIELLGDKDATYDLFEQLASDFNGDLFVTGAGERETVTTSQLQLLKDLLQGRVSAGQQPLFLWAYDFGVIPTDLISNMYELFYREEMSEERSSTYYTPPALVDFVLTDVLNERILDYGPTVCDPACGSGIFLVDAYRRIVRHEMQREGRSLSSDRLRELLLSRIAGCDIDDAAIRLAAFNLYVAFLNYQSPQDIRKAGPLPRLIYGSVSESGKAPLVVCDAFSPVKGESTDNDCEDSEQSQGLPWPANGFDVVVGNPPWTEIKGESSTLPEQWATRLGRAVGDRNPSQLFLWRALDLLTEDGVAALLVSAKAMLNTRSTSLEFRQQWLRQAKIEQVVNFSRIRMDFFASAVAPFMLVRFRRTKNDSSNMVIYDTARPVNLGRRGSSALARLDRRVVPQPSLIARDYLWKTYSAGSIRDDALMARLEIEDRLRDWTLEHARGFGFQRAGVQSRGREPSEFLRSIRVLSKFDSWGPLREEWFEELPNYVKYSPKEHLFQGRRLLVRWGVSPGFGPHARLETEPIAFRHTTYALSLDHLPPWQEKVILGTLLSSLGRYWLYMVSGSWGTWRDQVRSSDLLNLPLRLPPRPDETVRLIVRTVDELRHMNPQRRRAIAYTIPKEMLSIDEGVADLFELTDSERSLVYDFWASQGPDATQSLPVVDAVRGTEADLDRNSLDGIWPYLRVFLRVWNQRLGEKGEFRWMVWRDPRTAVIAVVLETTEFGSNEPIASQDGENWLAAIRRIGVQWEESESKSILRYGMVRVVTDTAIVIVKRDEQHLWTETAAWQDADATAAQIMSRKRP